MHMTCRRSEGGCGFEFCWLCLGPWSEHGDSTGGFYACNNYERLGRAGQLTGEAAAAYNARETKANAKARIEFYQFHVQRHVFMESSAESCAERRQALTERRNWIENRFAQGQVIHKCK